MNNLPNLCFFWEKWLIQKRYLEEIGVWTVGGSVTVRSKTLRPGERDSGGKFAACIADCTHTASTGSPTHLEYHRSFRWVRWLEAIKRYPAAMVKQSSRANRWSHDPYYCPSAKHNQLQYIFSAQLRKHNSSRCFILLHHTGSLGK